MTVIDAFGFAQGFKEQGEFRNRQRRELAQAFEQFKQSNPHASYADFQSFIDANVGSGPGSNYLRGGMPGQQVLQSLAAENAKQKAYADFQQRANKFLSQREIYGTLEGMVDGFLMDSDYNPDAAQEMLMNAIGQDVYSTLGSEFNISGMFAPTKVEARKRQEVERLIPLALNFIEASNGQIDLDELGMRLGANMSIVKPVMDAAKKEYDQRQTLLQEQKAQEAMLQKGRIENAMMSDPQLGILIERGGEGRAQSYMLDYVTRSMSDDQFILAYGVSKAEARQNPDIFREFYDARVKLLQETQGLQYEQNSRAAMQAADQMVSQYVSQNRETAEEYFSRANAEAASGPSGLQGSFAAISLSNEYQMTPTIINQISMLLRSLPEQYMGDSTAIKQYIKSHPDFQAVAQGRELSNVTDQMRRQAVRSVVGREGGIQPFSSFRESEAASIKQYEVDFQAEINRAANITDPVQAERRYASLAAQLQRDMAQQNEELRYAQNNRSFIQAGPDAWDDNLVFGENGESIEAQMNNMAQRLKQQLDTLANQALRMSQMAPPPAAQAPAAQSSGLSTTRSPFSAGVSNATSDYAAKRRVQSAILGGSTGFGSGVTDYFFADEVSADRRSGMRELMNTPGFLDRAASLYQSLPSADAATFLDDLGSMSRQSFESKYSQYLQPQSR
jgi:hypothetical protein